MKHGKGKWKKNDSLVICNQYTGDYYQDQKHGYGKFVWESGNWYEGQYYQDKRHGEGIMHWRDGTIYEGQWQFGAQHGKGRLVLPDGEVKEGVFENNVFREMIEDNESQHDFYPDLSLDIAVDRNKEDRVEQMKFEEQPPTEIQLKEFLRAERSKAQPPKSVVKEALTVDSANETVADKASQTKLTLKCIKKKKQVYV